MTEDKLKSWFKGVENYLISKDLLDIDGTRKYNCDETAFLLNPEGGTVLTQKGEKTVYSHVHDDKECLATLVCGNAAGQLVPSLAMFPYKRLPTNIASSMPKGWGIGHSDNGWMTGEKFYEYIANVFHPLLVENVQFPVVLFVDGHCSHLTFPLSQLCREKNIEIIALYPNATHILQPMNVAVFRPLKSAWAKVVLQWRLDQDGERLRRDQFAPLLDKALNDVDLDKVLKSGFRSTGFHPFTGDAINYRKYSELQRLKSQDHRQLH